MKDIKKFRENIIQIRAHVSERERMAVLAEEAAELADSAQVLLESITESRRGGRHWVFAGYAREDLLEEAADVMAVLLCCFNLEGIIACLAQARAEGRKSRGARERKEQLRELIDYCGFVRVMAFKSRRIDNRENPTDWTREQAEEFLASFTGELILQIYASLRDWEAAQTLERMEKKLERWAKRLKGETADGEREGVLLDKSAN